MWAGGVRKAGRKVVGTSREEAAQLCISTRASFYPSHHGESADDSQLYDLQLTLRQGDSCNATAVGYMSVDCPTQLTLVARICSMTNTSEKCETTLQGNLQGICQIVINVKSAMEVKLRHGLSIVNMLLP